MTDSMQPARVGILGGMGPAATADFYLKLVQATPAARDQDHIPVLMQADPSVPDRTESFLHGGPSPLPWLRRGAASLQAGGAELLVMPCNTAHLWYDPIACEMRTPMLHIVDAVAEALIVALGARAHGPLRIGLLGTTATLAGQLYPRRAALHAGTTHWRWVQPSREEQSELVEAGIAAVKGAELDRGAVLIGQALDALVRRGVDAVVHACTEVPLVLHAQRCAGLVAIDSTAALARLTVRRAWQDRRAAAASPLR
jgi:aspartate racemase